MPFHVINLTEARFDCSFGRGCPGVCCRDGRPPVYQDEAERIQANLAKFLPLVRPEARQTLERDGFLTGRVKSGQPSMRVVAGWCIFFHDGCTLHAAGAAEGDKLRYKPSLCALFPLEKDLRGRWFVRQKNYGREKWDLPCLDPAPDAPPAVESLREELALAESYESAG